MNWIDGVILGVLTLSVLVGLFRGLVSEVLSLAIWVAAFWVAWRFGPAVSAQLDHAISSPSLRYCIGYGACFVAVLIVGALVRFAMRRLIWSTGLSGIDRLLGMLFGFVRGVLIVTLLVFLGGLTAITREPWWQHSELLPRFQSTAAWLGQNVPADVSTSVRDHLKPSVVLERVKSSGVLDHVRDLSAPGHAPISGATPATAASRTASPAAAASAATHPTNY
jgi:membrane protein required for colicin V production